jgi:telomere length regulation protein
MTSELWDLLLSLRTAALAEKEVHVLEALLFALLMMLEVNEDKERLAREHARELVETSEWSRLVLERMEGGGSEGERVRMLAAGVVVRVGEVLERWRTVMVGGLVDV